MWKRAMGVVLAVVATGSVAQPAYGGSLESNDSFSNAEVLTPPEATSTRDRVSGTAQPGEPAHAGVPATHSLWYRFTAPANGTVRFDTCATPVDSHVAAYTGSQVDALTGVASNNGGCESPARKGAPRLIAGGGSIIEFPVTAGTVYSLVTDTEESTPADVTAHLLFTAAATPDTKAPKTTIIAAPKKKSKKRKARFEFTADEKGVSFACSLNGKPFAPCTSPTKVKGKRGKKNTFAVRATDAAGNVEGEPATYKWKVKKKKRR